jgi:hypothetical protein
MRVVYNQSSGPAPSTAGSIMAGLSPLACLHVMAAVSDVGLGMFVCWREGEV